MSHVHSLALFLGGRGGDFLVVRAVQGPLIPWSKPAEDLEHHRYGQLHCIPSSFRPGSLSSNPMQREAYMVVQVAV